MIVACGTESSAPVSCDSAGERGNIVISHTAKRHGLYGVRNISKHPVNVSSGPGTGSRFHGQLSRLSIGRIGLQLPGGGAQAEWQMRGCRCSKRLCVVSSPWWCLCRTRHGSSTLPTTVPSPTASPAGDDSQRPSRGCSAGVVVASGRADGLLSIDTVMARQPTTVMPLLISSVQAMQPRPGPAVGEQI